TNSRDFPTTPGALQSSLGGYSDGFVLKLNGTGSALVQSTYLGGSNDDSIGGLALDPLGNAYVTGATYSADFPITSGVVQAALKSPEDSFVTKLKSDGSNLMYSTYVGGSGDDGGHAIVVNQTGEAYVAVQTDSPDFPTSMDAVQKLPPGGHRDVVVFK